MAAENKIAHLQMIQSVITRMAGNSALLKGWAVTLVAASFALAANDGKHHFIMVAYMPTAMFWILDAYYLRLEQQYRALFEASAAKDDESTSFSMDVSSFSQPFIKAFLSEANLVFYGILLVLILVVKVLVARAG
jgi:hypothetical protein